MSYGRWKLVEKIGLVDGLELLSSYQDALSDDISWIGFLNMIENGVLWRTPDAWICLTSIRPGISACIHGGSINHTFSIGKDVLSLQSVLLFSMTSLNIRYLTAIVPDNLSGKLYGLMDMLGFVESGSTPASTSINGQLIPGRIFSLEV